MNDGRGNPIGTASSAALAHAEIALWRLVSFYDVPLADLDAAAAEDPAWCWPPLMRAGFLLSLTEPALLPDARAALEQAELRAAGASARERAHHAALSRCAAGDWAGACADWEQILLDHPRDLAALQWAHFFDLHRGDSRSLRSRVARVLPEWPHDDALRPYVLGLLAFGLEECGHFAQAEAVGREVCAGSAKVPAATHAVAHVLEMQGRHEDGRQWLAQMQPVWAENGFAVHHAWHLALFQVEAMDLAGALALYDSQLGGANAVLTLQRLDGAALLWRLQLLGADVGARWSDIALGWDLGVRDAGHSAFNDVHAFVVLLGLRDRVRAEALLAAAQRRAERGHETSALAAREVGVPLMRGLRAFHDGDLAEATRLLLPLRDRSAPLGGSHAQRELIDWTLLAASTAPGGERRLGRALLNERRVARGDTPLAAHWRTRLTR